MAVFSCAKTKRMLFALLFLAIAIMSGNCKKDLGDKGGGPGNPGVDPLETTEDVITSVSGTVVDEQGKPLPGVTVHVHGSSAITGEAGIFEIENIPVPGNRCVISCAKEGYFEGIRAREPVENGATTTHMVLMSANPTHSFNASSGGKATLTNGSEVNIPANALVDGSGNPYSGKVNMTVRYLDPSRPGFANVVPGGDMLAERTDNSTSILYSYGILRVKLTGIDGEELQIADGKQATLVMDIPDKQLSTAPPSIPLWYFHEEKGHWVEEGAATKQGDKYVGTVTHFTDWNCDVPGESATIIGNLVDCNGDPAWGHIEFGQIGQEGGNSTDTDSEDGHFEQRVPAGVPITLVVYDPLYLAPLLPEDQGKGKLIVLIPPLEPEEVYDVGMLQIFPCMSKIKASLKLKPGDNLEHLVFNLPGGTYRYISDVNATFSLGGFPPSSIVSMNLKTKSGTRYTKTFTTAAAGGELNLGLIDISSEQIAFVTGTIICGNTVITDGQVTATWNSGTGPQVEYTPPGNDGTFKIPVALGTSIRLSISTSKGVIEKIVTSTSTAGGTTDMGAIDVCTGPQPGPTFFTINGDGYTNRQISLTAKPYPNSAGIYVTSSGITTMHIVDISDTIRVVLTFPGKTTGTAVMTDETGVLIQRKNGAKITNYMGGFGLTGSTVQLHVTRYDAVGGLVEGTFQGTFIKDDGTTVTITNGKFSMLRQGDL